MSWSRVESLVNASVLAVVLMAGLPAALRAADGAGTAPLASDRPSLPVSIHGVLLDEHGQPINEGFLMLSGNPQLNALTGGDGRFRIEGEAWTLPDVLCASWAGCETAHIRLDQPQVDNLTVRLQPEDPAFAQIEMGMSLKVRWTPFYVSLRPLNDAQRDCIRSCDAFIASKGEAIIAKMLAGATLSPDEQRYEGVLASEIWIRSLPLSQVRESTMVTSFDDVDKTREIRYCADVLAGFDRVTLKALRRQQLTEADVHALRLMAAVHGSTGFDAASANYAQKLKLSFPVVALGLPLPFDVPVLRSSPLYTAPGWSDYTSLSATTHLRLEGIWPYLDSYWKWQIRDQTTLVQSPPEDWRKRYWQDWYQVTSVNELLRSSAGRPAYIVSSNFEDPTGFGFYTREAEYLRRAYRGKAEVHHLSVTSGTAFYDMWLDEWAHYGPNPRSAPLAGRDCPRWEDDHYTPLRHARTNKLVAMELPWASGEVYLDLQRDATFLGNQVAMDFNLVLDRDGKVAVPFPSGNWMSIPNRVFANYGAYLTYDRMGGNGYAFPLLHEQMLRALLRNQGRFRLDLLDHILVQYPQMVHAKDDIFVVTSVDPTRREIHTGWLDPGMVARCAYPGGAHPNLAGTEPKGDYVLKLQPDARIEVRCRDGKATWFPWGPEERESTPVTYRLGTLSDVRPGDRLFATIHLPEPVMADMPLSTLLTRDPNPTPELVKQEHRPGPLDMAAFNGKGLEVVRVMNYSHHDSYAGSNPRFMPLYGTIVKKEGDLITVSIHQQEIAEMLGYRFWKQEEGRNRATPNELASLFWPIIRRWGDGTEEDRTYRFLIDSATDTYRNGLVAKSIDLSVGDYVYVEYEIWWETESKYHEVICPERIQASGQEQDAGSP